MTSNESNFDFKNWLDECGFTEKEAAHQLQIPLSVLRMYVKGYEIPAQRQSQAESILNNLKSEKKNKRAVELLSKPKKSMDYQEALDDLLLCLNMNGKTNAFWPVADPEGMKAINPYLFGDVHGIQTISKRVQTKFEENKFQPYERTQVEAISLFYVIEFLPFDDNGKRWNDEEFYKYTLSTRYFKDKRKKLAERSIVYIFSNSTDTIVEKVLNDGENND